MDKTLRNKFVFNFAGGFGDEQAEIDFKNRIKEFENVIYHGLVSGDQKVNLFKNAHALCLPTLYFEGQSVCVLEAYAAGCHVITTAKGGLVDIFDDKVNGIKILEDSYEDIIRALQEISSNPEKVKNISIHNLKEAKTKYRGEAYDSNCIISLDL